MNINLKMNPSVFNKMVDYGITAYNEFKTEISGLLPILLIDGKFHAFEPSILKQTCTGADTVLEKESIAEYFREQSEIYKEYIPKNLFFC